MLDTTTIAAARTDPVEASRAAHRVRGNYMMGAREHHALASLLDVVGAAVADLPADIRSAYDQAVALLNQPTRPVWLFGIPLHGCPDTPSLPSGPTP